MDPRDEVSAEHEFYDHITQGPRSNPKRCITLHRPTGEGCLYLLCGEILGVERIISTANYERREQCKVYVMGNSFLVKESADEILDQIGWSAE